MIASYSGATDVVKEYLRVGANVKAIDGNGWTALHHASSNGYNEIVQLLLSHLSPPLTSNEDEDEDEDEDLSIHQESDKLKITYPLHLAAENGHTRVVETLLNHSSCDYNLTDGKNRTALHSAVKNNHLEIVELLLSTDIPINVCSDTGKSEIHNNLYLSVSFEPVWVRLG